jgi:hypothetical protein
MNINAKIHPKTSFDSEAKMTGLGANVLWNGPFDSTGYPKSKGSSSGKNGIKLRFDDPVCKPGPITQIAKSRF